MTVLDIGSGIRPQTLIDEPTTCVEPHLEYVEILRAEGRDVIHAEWRDVPILFHPQSFDHVTILDVIEHLDKDEGRRLLGLTIPIARKSVTVYTPHGFMPQEPSEDGSDAWGFKGGEWQRHRSGWTPSDFDGWSFEVRRRTDRDFFYARLNLGGTDGTQQG